MKIDDRVLKEAFQTEDDLPQEMRMFLSEQIGKDPDDTPVRQVKASEKRRELSGNGKRGLVTGALAIAALIALIVLAVKVIPGLRMPTASHGEQEDNASDTIKDTETIYEVEQGTEPADETGAQTDTESASSEMDASVLLSELISDQDSLDRLIPVSDNEHLDLLQIYWETPDELLAVFQVNPGYEAISNIRYCTAYFVRENGEPKVRESYIYRVSDPEAQDALDLIYIKFKEVYDSIIFSQKMLDQGTQAAIDAFFENEAIFGPPGNDICPDEEKEELRAGLKTTVITDARAVFGEYPEMWLTGNGLTFSVPRFIVGLQLDKEHISEELFEKYAESIWGQKEYFYIAVGFDGDICSASVNPSSVDLISYITYKNIPVGAGRLRWGMTEDEVIEVLGEPDERSDRKSNVVLSYARSVETELDYGKCCGMELVIGHDVPLSDNEVIKTGLYYITLDYEKETAGAMGGFGVPFQSFYGRPDGRDKADPSAYELSLIDPDMQKESEESMSSSEENAGPTAMRYRWYAWEIRNYPDLKLKCQERLAAQLRYLEESDGTELNFDDYYSGDHMLVTACVVFSDDKPDESEAVVSVTLDAGLYLMVTAPIVKTADAEAADTGDLTVDGVSKTAEDKPVQYIAADYLFTMPDLWAENGAEIATDGNEMNVMYRGVKLCTILVAPAEEIEQKAEEYRYAACVEIEDGKAIAMWVWGKQHLTEIYTDGSVTGEDEAGKPIVYTKEEDLADILGMFIGWQVDVSKLKGQAENEESTSYMESVSILVNRFVSSYALNSVYIYSQEYKSHHYKPFDPEAKVSTYLAGYLNAEPFSYEGLPETLEGCQIPEDVLQEMTDRTLLLTVLDYPYYDLLIDPGNYASYTWGDEASQTFNGFRELTQVRNRLGILSLLNHCYDHIEEEYGPLMPHDLLTFLNQLRLYIESHPAL